MDSLKLGYVGCGFMAQKVHIPNIVTIPDCELLALAELRPALGRKVQARYRIPRLYADHRALTDDPDVTAVVVSGHFSGQGEIARDLLLAGKHVFVEKPMAVTVPQAERILAAGRQVGARLMVGYMKRYDAGNELVKEAIARFRETEELGEVTYARLHGFTGEWICNLDTPMETTEEPVPPADTMKPDWLPDEFVGRYIGYLQQYTHNINLIRWLLDADDRVRVKAVDLDADGRNGVVILDVDGIRVVLESGRVSYYGWEEHTQIYFRHGWVHTWAPPLLLRNVPAKVEIYRGAKGHELSYPIPSEGWTWSYRREMEHFIAALRNGEPFRSSGEDTLTDVRLFEEIYQIYVRQR
ncbi:MAG: Gfo/Idh/MocA family oxidoreductase [Candidatus Latescibacteria bacterium]|nr:Gfo/Idh/MocA family oxidoreductase [Candidatus Latescibacterota bacterium]